MSFERAFEPPFPDPANQTGNYLGEENPFDDYWDEDYSTDEVYIDGPFYETIDGIQVPLEHDESKRIETKAELVESDDPDDNPYGIVYDQRGKRIATTTHEILSDAAYEVGDIATWQFMGIKGNKDQDVFHLDVLSKDAITPLKPGDFGDIADCVTIDTMPTDDPLKMQGIAFDGTRAQLEDFIVYLREKFAFPVDEDADPLKGICMPAMLFASVVSRKSG